MRSFLILISLALIALIPSRLSANEPITPTRPLVFQARLENEAISPVTARFLKRAIEQAELSQATCLVIVLDTPGGLVDSTRDVVKHILSSRVPVVVYVAPAGARAASAGVFITLSAHVAAMAPGTNIGAAHPVQIGGLSGMPSQPPERKEDQKQNRSTSPLDDKVLNDTVAWARSLAEFRGRNADWAKRTVKESLSVSASEALSEKAIDLVAADLEELLQQLDGREVKVTHGSVRLRTANAEVRSIDMWWGEQLLGTFANPNIAFLLLLFGFYGILFEMYTPGWGVAGTVGVICLVLGFFALAVLPVNYVGLALIALAMALFVAEAFVTSYGFLTMGGVACMVLGGVMLVESPTGFQQVSLSLVIPAALATASVTFFLVTRIVQAQRRVAMTGSEGLVGSRAKSVEPFTRQPEGYSGMIRIHGELWKAISPSMIESDQAVEVVSQRGLTLHVQPWYPNQERPSVLKA